MCSIYSWEGRCLNLQVSTIEKGLDQIMSELDRTSGGTLAFPIHLGLIRGAIIPILSLTNQ